MCTNPINNITGIDTMSIATLGGTQRDVWAEVTHASAAATLPTHARPTEGRLSPCNGLTRPLGCTVKWRFGWAAAVGSLDAPDWGRLPAQPIASNRPGLMPKPATASRSKPLLPCSTCSLHAVVQMDLKLGYDTCCASYGARRVKLHCSSGQASAFAAGRGGWRPLEHLL